VRGKTATMTSLGARVVKATSRLTRSLGNVLDSMGASMEVAKYTERLVPSTRFVAVDGLVPQMAPGVVFVAPSASIIGDVTIGNGSSVWYGAAIRGDVNKVVVGENSNIGDRTVVHVARIQGDYATFIGDNVTVGPGAIIHAATLNSNCMIGAGAQVLDSAIVESLAIVAPGAVVTPKTVVPAKQLWAGSPAKMVRALTDEEVASISETADGIIEVAYIHAEECNKDADQLHEDELEYEDKRVRSDDYFPRPKPGEIDRDDVGGLGSPGLIFDDALNNPEKWLKVHEQEIKEKYKNAVGKK